MSSREFAGLDLVLGTVRGFRSWKPTVEGRLTALHQNAVWLPGENNAVCNASAPKNVRETWGEGLEWKKQHELTEEWRSAHEFADCDHGFYAYFGSEDRYYTSEPYIHGVIEGYGEVLIGTKGFRATKARIVALSIEPVNGMWNLEQFVVDRIRRNYPKAAFFESSLAMSAEFPAEDPKQLESAFARDLAMEDEF